MTHDDGELIAATQWIAHRLGRYAAAVDAMNAHAVVAALDGAEVTFKATGPLMNEEVREFYASSFASSAHRTAHFPGAPVTTRRADGVAFEAPYLRVALDVRPPVLDSVGRYRGRIARDGSAWRWIQFIVAAE